MKQKIILILIFTAFCLLNIQANNNSFLFNNEFSYFDTSSDKKTNVRTNLTDDQRNAIIFTATGAGSVVIGAALIGAGAGLVSYFFSNVDILSYNNGIPAEYTWRGATTYTDAHLAYYYPGIALIVVGGVVAVAGIALVGVSGYFWYKGYGKKKSAINFDFRPGINTEIGLSINL